MSTLFSPPPPTGLPATLPATVTPPGVSGLAIAGAQPPSAAATDPAAPPARSRRPTTGEMLHRYRIDGWTPIKVGAFIEVLGETGSVARAAAYFGMPPASAYRLRNRAGAEPCAEAVGAAAGVAGCTGDCAGDCPACDAPVPSARALFDAALAAETALPPDVEATMLARRERAAGLLGRVVAVQPRDGGDRRGAAGACSRPE